MTNDSKTINEIAAQRGPRGRGPLGTGEEKE